MRVAPSVLLPALLLPLVAGAAPSFQPDERGETVPDRPFDVQRLRLDLTVDPAAGTVAGTASFHLRRLHAGPLRLDEVALTITSVTVAGAPVVWREGVDQIAVPVVDAAGKDLQGEVDVVVAYSATPRTGLHFRRPMKGSPDTYTEVWSQGEGEDNRYWFPGYDHPNDRFDYEGVIHAPPGYKTLTNSGVNLTNYLVMLAVGPYDVFGDDRVSVWVPPGTPRSAIAPILDPIPEMMTYFAERTGVPYAWGPYRQVIVQRFLYGGMENTSATIESRRLLATPVNLATRPSSEAVAAHELAHQWYGDLLTCRTWRELWLNEGFATFMAGDWAGRGDRVYDLAATERGYYQGSLSPGSLAGRYFQGPAPADNFNVYSKGASVLTMLRRMLGEDTFWAGIRLYTQEHQKGLVETSDLRRAMEEVSGYNLDWFFEQWVELPYVPALQSSWASTGDDTTVHLAQTPAADAPLYTLPVTIEVGDGTPGHTLRKRVWLTTGSLDVVLQPGFTPTWVAVDADGGLLADLQEVQPVGAWVAQLASSPTPYARLFAVEQLGKQKGEDVQPATAALVRVASSSEALALRLAAVRELGNLRARDALGGLLADPEPRVRLAVAEAFVTAAVSADGDRLAAARGDEANADIRSALLRAIAAADPARGLTAARQVLRSTAAPPGGLPGTGTDEAEFKAAIGIVGETGDGRDLPALLVTGVSRDRRTGGLGAAVRIVSREAVGPAREALRGQVARSAEALLDDLDLRGRQGAIGVLREVGDTTSVRRLEELLRVEEVRSVQTSIRDAIVAIGARDDKVRPDSPNEVAARMDELARRVDALEKEQHRWMDQ